MLAFIVSNLLLSVLLLVWSLRVTRRIKNPNTSVISVIFRNLYYIVNNVIFSAFFFYYYINQTILYSKADDSQSDLDDNDTKQEIFARIVFQFPLWTYFTEEYLYYRYRRRRLVEVENEVEVTSENGGEEEESQRSFRLRRLSSFSVSFFAFGLYLFKLFRRPAKTLKEKNFCFFFVLSFAHFLLFFLFFYFFVVIIVLKDKEKEICNC